MDTPDCETPSTTNNNSNKSNNNKNNSKLINPSSSDSSAFQDSPIYSFISNLSPIQPVKAAPLGQGFPGLASPPLIFNSPRINLPTSFLSRQLQSSTSNSEFSEENDKCPKKDGHPDDSARVDISLKIPTICGDEAGCNRKNSVQVAAHHVSAFHDEFNLIECADSSNKRLSGDPPQSLKGGCLVQKDNLTIENKVLDGSELPKVTENAQAKLGARIKLVKLESRRLMSASSERSSIFAKLSSGLTSEASHVECGSLRRCLFDENYRKCSSDGSGSQNLNDDLTSSKEVANASSSVTVDGRQVITLSKPITGVCASPTTTNYPVAISKPLGIGLHLNSVVYPRSTDNAIGGEQSSEKVVRVIGKTSVFVANNRSAGKVNDSSISTNLIGKFSTCSEEKHQDEASLVAASGNPFALDVAEHLKDPIVLKPDDPSPILLEKRKFNSEPAETNKFNPGSPRKKRKKSSGTSDDDTSKRCNCKRSKCLKLYCDCFAAGLYCAESCACQGCFNRAEHEETVLETRQQIESRNPLAFAPKVVQAVNDSPATEKEVGTLSTPSSARHKRGCNCKRSMCLKKYCECYQSNVGCSDGCRCEGCKNVYGKREDNSFSREFMIKKVANETPESLEEKQHNLTGSSDNLKSRLHAYPHVTPVTPTLQCSDQRKNALKSRLPFRRFLQSSDSDHDTLPSEAFSACPADAPSHSMLLEGTERSRDVASSKSTDLGNFSGPQTSVGIGLPPPSSQLRWRSSPMTPITESARSEYLQDFDSGGKDSRMLEDDTPEILKDSANTSDSVKVRSPNKKRVSPPHNHKTSSDSLKVCQKFVLRAVSAFPPLSPYSRSSGNDNKGESLDQLPDQAPKHQV